MAKHIVEQWRANRPEFAKLEQLLDSARIHARVANPHVLILEKCQGKCQCADDNPFKCSCKWRGNTPKFGEGETCNDACKDTPECEHKLRRAMHELIDKIGVAAENGIAPYRRCGKPRVPTCSRCKGEGQQRNWRCCALRPIALPSALQFLDTIDLPRDQVTAICVAAVQQTPHPKLQGPIDWTGFEETHDNLRNIFVSGAQPIVFVDQGPIDTGTGDKGLDAEQAQDTEEIDPDAYKEIEEAAIDNSDEDSDEGEWGITQTNHEIPTHCG